jgi:LacI family transcriptional regulator
MNTLPALGDTNAPPLSLAPVTPPPEEILDNSFGAVRCYGLAISNLWHRPSPIPPMPRITLRAIAEKVGCTRSAVSYGLRSHPTISVELREKIKAAAMEMGWSPDANLRQQMALIRSSAKRTDAPNIGLILNRSKAEFTSWPTLKEHFRGMCERAAELGFGVDVFRMKETPLSVDRLDTVLKTRGISGVIFVDIDMSSTGEYLALAANFASVAVGFIAEDAPLHTVTVDYLALGRRAIRELTQMGFKRPGIVLTKSAEQIVRWSFTGGLQTGLVSLPEVDRIPMLYCGEDTSYIPVEEFQRIEAWVEAYRPDVLLAVDTYMLKACFIEHPVHSKIPIYSLDWHPNEGADGGIDQSSYEVGVAGLEVVVAQLDRGEKGLPRIPRSTTVREKWVRAGKGENGLPHYAHIIEAARKVAAKRERTP